MMLNEYVPLPSLVDLTVNLPSVPPFAAVEQGLPLHRRRIVCPRLPVPLNAAKLEMIGEGDAKTTGFMLSRSGASDDALGRGIEAEQGTNYSIGFDVGSRDDSLCGLSPLGKGAN